MGKNHTKWGLSQYPNEDLKDFSLIYDHWQKYIACRKNYKLTNFKSKSLSSFLKTVLLVILAVVCYSHMLLPQLTTTNTRMRTLTNTYLQSHKRASCKTAQKLCMQQMQNNRRYKSTKCIDLLMPKNLTCRLFSAYSPAIVQQNNASMCSMLPHTIECHVE